MGSSVSFAEMHVLITGGAGFIGSNLAEYLINNGQSAVLDNLLSGHMENITHLLNHENFNFIQGDIRDYETCRQAVKGCTHVSHQAALGSVPRSIDDPLLSLSHQHSRNNECLLQPKEEGVKRIVFASSSSVYGADETLPKVEEKNGNVAFPYASSKKSTELIQQAFVSCYDMEIIDSDISTSLVLDRIHSGLTPQSFRSLSPS